MRHLRYALRTLIRHRSYSILGLLTLGLAIGANAVVFSIARGLLLRPLPIADADRVYFVAPAGKFSISFPAYRDLRARNRTFADLAAYRIAPMALNTDTGSRRVWGYLATGNYFSMLGVRPAVGRLFTAADDATPGAAPLVVLSYQFWRAAFAGDPQVTGRTIRINDRPYTILGVAAAGFIGTEVIYRPDVWIPMAMQGQIEGRSWLDNRFTQNTMMIGRLAASVSATAAAADLSSISAALAREHPDSDVPARFQLSRPGLFGEGVRMPARTMLTGVMILAVLVLLTACANMGGLLAARIIDRTREIGIRLALGARRIVLIRDVATETLTLAAGATIAGYLVAVAVLEQLTAWSPADLPFAVDVNPDVAVIAFAALTTVAAAAFACAAAVRRAWTVPLPLLTSSQSANTGSIRRRWSAREWLLVVQVAACSVLLTASAVAIQSVRAAAAAPIGFRPDGLGVVALDVGLVGYSREQTLAFDRQVVAAVSRVPGVTRAAITTSLPLGIDQSSTDVFREGETNLTPARSLEATYYYVTPGYFDTVGTRLIAGRDFTDLDDRTHPSVAIVNEAFARRVVGTANAVGRRFQTNGRAIEIIGIAEDGNYRSLTETPQLVLFRPRTQLLDTNVSVLVRSSTPINELVPQIRAAVVALDPRVPVLYQGAAKDVIALAFLPSNAAGIALSAFGALAVILAITGVYSIAAFAVSRRTRDIGIRVAVGARRPQVLKSVLGRIAVCVGIGGAVGLVGGTAASQFLTTILYGAAPRDPVVILPVVAMLTLVAIGAGLAPARRAIRVDPVVALRAE
jgi:predicted permease